MSAAGETRPVALTIAGVDSSGGAGVAADLRTFETLGVRGTVAVTAVTAQSTLGLHAVEAVTPELVRAQIGAVASEMGVAAAKTGMLATVAVVEAVSDAVRDFGLRRLVVDPVLVASAGGRLLEEDGVKLVRDRLVPLATVLTPNLAEAAALTGLAVDDRAGMEAAAAALAEMGAEVVMVTGGHLDEPDGSPDLVLVAGGSSTWLEGERVPGGERVHGTGCVLSAAVCAQLALGFDPVEACRRAKAELGKLLPR